MNAPPHRPTARTVRTVLAAALLALTLTACPFRSSDSRGNHAPILPAAIHVAPAGAPYAGQLIATDPDGDALAYTVVGPPPFGDLQLDPSTGSFTYRPSPGEIRRDTARVRASDGRRSSDVVDLSFFVTGEARRSVPTVFDDGGVLQGGLEPPGGGGGAFTYALLAPAMQGTLTLDPVSGAFDYAADPGASGYDELLFRVTDDGLVSDPIAVRLVVDTVQLTLPHELHHVVGTTGVIRFDDVVFVDDYRTLQFEVDVDGQGDPGTSFADRWEFALGAGAAGVHSLTVTVRDGLGNELDRATCPLVVHAPLPGLVLPTDVLVIGDSITAPGLYLRDLAAALSGAGVSGVRFVGTVMSFGNGYEGYNGNRWETFATELSARSPFVFAGTGLDFERYFDQVLGGERPELVFVLLGHNDMFATLGDTYAEVRANADAVFATADALLDELRRSLPDAHFVLATVIVPNAREAAFVTRYGGTKSREDYRRVQHAYVRLQQEHFSGREAEGIHGLSDFHGLDTVAGFPLVDPLHPNETGYGQIADMWLGPMLDALLRYHAP